MSFDRLKLQPASLVEHQFEQIQTLIIQEGDPSRTEEENKETPPETPAEAQPQEQPAAEVTAVEPAEETAAEPVAPQGQSIQAGAGQTRFKIIEENNRIIVTQVETAPTPGNPAQQ